jgi:hypothetical protein
MSSPPPYLYLLLYLITAVKPCPGPSLGLLRLLNQILIERIDFSQLDFEIWTTCPHPPTKISILLVSVVYLYYILLYWLRSVEWY